MDNQAREAREMTKQLPFKERMINFWFYNKWIVLGVVAAIFVIVFTIYEINNTPSYDALVAVYTSSAMPDETVSKLNAALSEYCNDVNEDGQVSVSITPMSGNRQDGSEESVAVETRIMSELNSGDNDIYIVDQDYYDFLTGDVYGECFSQTYRFDPSSPLMQDLGYEGNLYLLVRDFYPSHEGKADKRAAYNNAVAIYQGIAGIETPAEED